MSDDIVTRAAEVIGKELGYSIDYDGWPRYTMTLDPKYIAQALADAGLLAAPIPDDVQAVVDAAVAVVAAMESDDARDLPHALVALVSAVDDRAAL